jgi:hypothetical protein
MTTECAGADHAGPFGAIGHVGPPGSDRQLAMSSSDSFSHVL